MNYSNIVVLTGAGISVASGLPTYRGSGGLWTTGDVNLATRESMDTRPLEVWNTFAAFRQNILAAKPNAAHLALAKLESTMSKSGKVTIVTQNVDGLHRAAGSTNVVQLHGDVMMTRCDARCGTEPFRDETGPQDTMPTCAECGANLRPDIVLFGEPLPADAEWAVKMALRDCDLFIAIGTSGTVTPASNYVRSADYNGARTVLINPEPMEPPNPYFHEHIMEKAEIALPNFVDGLAPST